MVNLIVTFAKIEDARNIKNVLIRNGFGAAVVCTTGAQAVNHAESLETGVVICGWRFPDMTAGRLKELLPSGFDMLLVASPAHRQERRNDIVFVGMPLKVQDLVHTLAMICQAQEARRRKKRETGRVRSEQDRNQIRNAKRLLMERNGMTEEEAHRYLQKCSMESGTNMVETAQMIISLLF
jgi:response regulator NasT